MIGRRPCHHKNVRCVIGEGRNLTRQYLRRESNDGLTVVDVTKSLVVIQFIEGDRILDVRIVVLYD